MKGLLGIVLAASILLFATTPSSAQDTGSRNIIDFGCHTDNSICYATIDGTPVGVEFGCSSNNVRWNADVSPGGKRLFAMVQGAFLSNTRVSFFINGCLPEQTAFPTFAYASVTK